MNVYFTMVAEKLSLKFELCFGFPGLGVWFDNPFTTVSCVGKWRVHHSNHHHLHHFPRFSWLKILLLPALVLTLRDHSMFEGMKTSPERSESVFLLVT